MIMGFIQNSIIINNNKNVSIDGNPIVKGIFIQGNIVYKKSSDTSNTVSFDFVDLNNVSVIDGIWDSQNMLIFNTEYLSLLTPNIFFDFADLTNVSVIEGVWDSQNELIFNTEITLPIVLSFFFDFENLSNLIVIDGVWDMQNKLIFNTEFI